jgi:hypothetical protein
VAARGAGATTGDAGDWVPWQRGARPIRGPFATRLELIVNLKTAKALGLTVPDMILARADEVIE